MTEQNKTQATLVIIFIGHPPAVGGEGHILDAAGGVAPVQGVEVMDSGEGGAQGVGRNPKKVEVLNCKI